MDWKEFVIGVIDNLNRWPFAFVIIMALVVLIKSKWDDKQCPFFFVGVCFLANVVLDRIKEIKIEIAKIKFSAKK